MSDQPTNHPGELELNQATLDLLEELKRELEDLFLKDFFKEVKSTEPAKSPKDAVRDLIFGK
jgi:hypothetical protein